MSGQGNVATWTLDQKILGLAEKHQFTDDVMNMYIEAKQAEDVQRRVYELINSNDATVQDKSKARMLESSIAYMRRAEHLASREERIARHKVKMSGQPLNLSIIGD